MAKSIELVGSEIKNLSIERAIDGAVTLTVVGWAKDGSDNLYSSSNLVIDWDDLPANVKNTGTNFLKQVSREFNVHAANEDSETWE